MQVTAFAFPMHLSASYQECWRYWRTLRVFHLLDSCRGKVNRLLRPFNRLQQALMTLASQADSRSVSKQQRVEALLPVFQTVPGSLLPGLGLTRSTTKLQMKDASILEGINVPRQDTDPLLLPNLPKDMHVSGPYLCKTGSQ